MAGINDVPERLINSRIYVDGNTCLGTGDVDLPSIEYMTETISGAGIAGEADTPILGHLQSMTIGITWRTIEASNVRLAAMKAHSLDIRGSQQIYDSAKGEYKTLPVRVSVKAAPKSVQLGKFAVGATTDTKTELEVTYLKVDIDGKTEVEIDKFNYVAKFGGEDQLESVRKDLGM